MLFGSISDLLCAICTFLFIRVFRIVFIVSFIVRELLILASNDDEVSIFVWNARVACPRSGYGGIFGNLDPVEVSMILWNVVRSSFDR